MIKVTGVGRVVKDATVFSYGDGKSGVSFTIASNDSSAENSETTFLDCVVFNRDDKLAQYIKMGNQMVVNGDLKIHVDKDTGNRYTKVIVLDLEFGAKKT